jgi:Protein of unknown function (DUF3891)
VFRSRSRPVVYPQAEHARVAAAIAAAWGSDRPPLPFESLIRGVALHDRGYGELDTDGIGETDDERWLEIQRRGFAPQDDDPVVELVVALHIHRLVSYGDSPARRAAATEFGAALPARREAAHVTEAEAAAADRVTNLCDRISFELCFEHDTELSVGGHACTTTADGVATIDPWPLAPERLAVLAVGYESDGYPESLRPVERTFVVQPA